MNTLIVTIITLVCAGLMIGVFPLVLNLKVKPHLKTCELDDESFVKLSEDQQKAFASIRVVKDEDGHYIELIITPNENTTKADITFVYHVFNSHVKVKGYKLRFKYGNDIKLILDEPVNSFSLYLNQLNDNPKHEHIVQTVDRKNVEAFIAFEWLAAAFAACLIVYDVITNSNVVELFQYYGFAAPLFPITVILTVLICVGMYFILRYVVFLVLGKYIYGGKFDD